MGRSFVPLMWRLGERKARYIERLLEPRHQTSARRAVLEVEAGRFDDAQAILYMPVRLTRRTNTLLEVPEDHSLLDALPELQRIVATVRKRPERPRSLER